MLAWLAVLAAAAAIAAYAVVTGPQTRPVDDRPRLSMSLPAPPTPQRAAAPEPSVSETSGPENEAAAGSDAPAPDAAASAADAAAGSPDAGSPDAGSQDAGASAADTAQTADTPAAGAAPDAQGGPDGTAPQQPAEAAGAGEPAGGVAANIPQPPTQDQARPTDLLGDNPAGRDADTGPQPTATADTRRQTASRGDGRAPTSDDGAGATGSMPQLPVSDPDAPAWKRYAQRMTPPQGMPKIAIIVRGLGLSSAAAETAVNQLPANVSLSFTPYARDRAKAWAAEARRNGHEVLVDLPMEPGDYPATDPGPQAIMTEISTRENLQRLDWLLGQVDREVGAVAQMGSAVLANRQVAEPVLRALKERGLMFVDNGIVADSAARDIARRLGLPFAVNDRTLDGGQVSRRAIEARLVEAERLAREQGLAVVMAHPYPVSLELLVAWTDELEARGFVLVPATYAAIERAGQNAAQLR